MQKTCEHERHHTAVSINRHIKREEGKPPVQTLDADIEVSCMDCGMKYSLICPTAKDGTPALETLNIIMLESHQ